MNQLLSDLKRYKRIFTSATGRHAQLYYRRATESYDIATKQWKHFELIQHDYENLILAANYFDSAGSNQIAKEIHYVSLALSERFLQNQMKESQDLVEQARSTAGKAQSLINEYDRRADELSSRIDQALARARSIAASIRQAAQGEDGTTELSDQESEG